MSLYYLDNKKPVLSLPINCVEWKFNSVPICFQRHYHRPVEILVMLGGELLCTANNRSYRLVTGDILLLNPYTLHQGEPAAPNCHYLCITFSLDNILKYPNSVLSSCAEKVENGDGCFDEFYPSADLDTKKICELSEQIHACLNKNTPSHELAVLSAIYRLMEILYSRHYREAPQNASRKRSAAFMQKLSQYLSQHYSEPITAKDAAKALFMSASHFSHLIRQNFGVSFSKYLCEQRIIYAMKDHSGSELSIKDIATAVGFNDYCYFSRSFKKYVGQSPAFYFKKWKA